MSRGALGGVPRGTERTGSVPVRTSGADHQVAPAKLTVSLRVLGTRSDGYHRIEAEMLTVDLVDELRFVAGHEGLTVVADLPLQRPLGDLGPPDRNLVTRALALTGRRAHVTLVKRIPPRAGLGGGSADAGAVLRWAGLHDPAIAARLGADVPFCVRGGRAMVSGVGEQVTPLPDEHRRFVLVLPPVGVDTAACYAAWDELAEQGSRPAPGDHGNDLEPAALAVCPALANWRDALWAWAGTRPRLAGSGSTWFVEVGRDTERCQVGEDGVSTLVAGHERAPLVLVETTPASGIGA
jgi:4-diphosphocytidyl-2-C-methyl-D-erythritol kinase